MKEQQYRKVLRKAPIEQREEIFLDALFIWFEDFLMRFKQSPIQCRAILDSRVYAWERLVNEFPISHNEAGEPEYLSKDIFLTMIFGLSNQEDPNFENFFRGLNFDKSLVPLIMEWIPEERYRKAIRKYLKEEPL